MAEQKMLVNNIGHNSESIANKVCSQIGSKRKAIFQSHVETCISWTSFHFLFKDFFQQSASENKNLLCYWPTTHNPIFKVCPKFQFFSPHFYHVDDLKLCEEKMCNSNLCRIICVDQGFAVKNSGISIWIPITVINIQ